MRDIADTLAFLAIKTLIDGGFDLGPDRKDMRRTLSGAFEDLLNRLPEGAVPVVDPLGYVVLATREKSVTVVGPAWSDDAKATGLKERLERDVERHPGIWHGAKFSIGEVREVQP